MSDKHLMRIKIFSHNCKHLKFQPRNINIFCFILLYCDFITVSCHLIFILINRYYNVKYTLTLFMVVKAFNLGSEDWGQQFESWQRIVPMRPYGEALNQCLYFGKVSVCWHLKDLLRLQMMGNDSGVISCIQMCLVNHIWLVFQ